MEFSEALNNPDHHNLYIHVRVHVRVMVTKTLTITEDAYNLLTDNKMEEESFSEEIRRILSRRGAKSLKDYFGILSEKEGEEMITALEQKRTENRRLMKRRMRELYT